MSDSFPAPDGSDEATDASPGRHSRRTVWIVAAAVILVAGAVGLWLGTRQRQADSDSQAASATRAEAPDAMGELPADVELAPADLYFAGADGRLYAERRDLPAGTPAERARVLVAALLAGPSGGAASGLRAPLPDGSRIETVYLLGTTAVLDLRPPEPENPADAGPPSPAEARLRRLSYGSMQELLAVYSLVNTVVLGVEGVDSVQLLWDGRQPETLAGHVDTTRPLTADPSYLASS